MKTSNRCAVERVQTGVRTKKRSLKVMKALAEYHDLTLGDLIEDLSGKPGRAGDGEIRRKS